MRSEAKVGLGMADKDQWQQELDELTK